MNKRVNVCFLNRIAKYFVLTTSVLIVLVGSVSAEQDDINTWLMGTTFKVEGQSKTPGKSSIGTVFLVAKPSKGNPGKGYPILVTAAHVLDEMTNDVAVLYLRRKQSDVDYVKETFPLRIRENGKPLWTRHPEVDVAAMYLGLPSYVSSQQPLLTLDLLADDILVEKQALHPSDELLCLGYPLGLESSAAGFPVLRSGKIASYPLRPSSKVKSFLFDMQVYGGNSGGPVYFEYTGRRIGGGIHMNTVRAIVGLVSQDVSYTQQFEGYFESGTRRAPLGLAVVIPAEFIKRTIELLPATPD